ncbi:MAG: sigma-54 dependent transcriptional regulator [Chitinophagaceae bacterium]
MDLKAKMLIVEDQFVEANNLAIILKNAGCHVCSIAKSVATALTIIEEEKPEMVLIDIFLQGNLTGIDLAGILRQKKLPFVFLSANSNLKIMEAAKATRPYGFLTKPFRKLDVLMMLDVAWYLYQQEQSAMNMKGEFPLPGDREMTEPDGIIGGSEAINVVKNRIRNLAASDSSVLIIGESGTGKELVARDIHHFSKRRNKPFVIVRCAMHDDDTLIESELFGHEKDFLRDATDKKTGKFEEADGGTIFLDDITVLPLKMQVRLLRVLQQGEIIPIGGSTLTVDVRVIAACDHHLEEEMNMGKFRTDLYYRLNVLPLIIPPLRDRIEDILPLAAHFLRKYATEQGKAVYSFGEEAQRRMLHYHWPGNVLELRNFVEQQVLLANSPVIGAVQLPGIAELSSQQDPSGNNLKTMEEYEKDYILIVLERCNWKISGKDGAAEILGLKVSTLNSRIKKLGLDDEIAVRKSIAAYSDRK